MVPPNGIQARLTHHCQRKPKTHQVSLPPYMNENQNYLTTVLGIILSFYLIHENMHNIHCHDRKETKVGGRPLV